MKPILTGILIIIAISLHGQKRVAVNGRVIDKNTREALIGATIYIKGTTEGTISNEEGYFLLRVLPGNHIVAASYLGYQTDTAQINTSVNQTLNFNLTRSLIQTEEVIVTAKNPEDNIKSIETGEVRLSMREIKKLPALMGESDFLRIIQLSPGISSANDGNSGFYVRGGGADQNLVLLDNATIYNANHVLGFFSVFNSKTIANTKLIKSGMPAQYGGRLSSIVNVSTRDGDYTKYGVTGSIGLLSSGVSIEGPIGKDKLSFLIAARRSYISEVLQPLVTSTIKNSSGFYQNSEYYFYDLNAKLSFKPNRKDKISISYYQGGDDYKISKPEFDFANNLKWGNKVLALNWSHNFDKGYNLATSVTTTNYAFNLSANQNTVNVNLFSGVNDFTFKSILTKTLSKGTIIKTGIEHVYHQFRPNNLDASALDTDLELGSNRLLNSHETSLFYNHETNIIGNLRAGIGVRLTNYMHVGPYNQMIKNAIGEITDTITYSNKDVIKTYQSVEPRLSLRYQINKLSSVKGAVTYNTQYIHLVSSSSVTLPTDVWLPSTNLIEPQKGVQYTCGYFRNVMEHTYTSSINVYYKDFKNQIELLSGYIGNFKDNIFEESMVFGSGNSYGMELWVQKQQGRLSGWIGYTLSKTNRQFDEINEGKIYPAKYDRKHDINVVVSYDLNQTWSLSGTFIYATGNALTLPEAKYVIEKNIITDFGETNTFRMPDYHRLDLSVNYLLSKTKKFESSLNFSIFNVYNRANPFYIYFEIDGDIENGNINITPKQLTLFPIMPSITWSFKF